MRSHLERRDRCDEPHLHDTVSQAGWQLCQTLRIRNPLELFHPAGRHRLREVCRPGDHRYDPVPETREDRWRAH